MKQATVIQFTYEEVRQALEMMYPGQMNGKGVKVASGSGYLAETCAIAEQPSSPEPTAVPQAN